MSIEIILGTIFASLGIKNKPQIKFFKELYELIFSIQGRINFENMSRFSQYNESTFRRRFAEFFDWLGFNQSIISSAKVEAQGIMICAIDYRHNCKLTTLYGATTFGLQWQFIRYTKGFAEVDSTVYYINQLPQILGILQHIVETQKKYWI